MAGHRFSPSSAWLQAMLPAGLQSHFRHCLFCLQFVVVADFQSVGKGRKVKEKERKREKGKEKKKRKKNEREKRKKSYFIPKGAFQHNI